MSYSKLLQDDGRISNFYPKSETTSAGGAGWFFSRLMDLIVYLDKQNSLKKYFSDDELNYFKDLLEKSISSLLKHHSDCGLIVNGPLETWMDTSFFGDTREGRRIVGGLCSSR